MRVRLRPGVAALRALRFVEDMGAGAALVLRRRCAGAALESHLRQLPGMRSVQTSPLTGSILLEYDPEIMPFTLVDAFFAAPALIEPVSC